MTAIQWSNLLPSLRPCCTHNLTRWPLFREIDTAANKFFTNWDRETLTFTLQIHFKDKKTAEMPPPPPPPPGGFAVPVPMSGPASGPPPPPPM